MQDNYPRNWQGFGNNPPIIHWSGDARIAVNFVLNYEEGSERNILDGDESSEDYLTDIPNLKALLGQRHYSAESMFAYGARVGCWRLLEVFDKHNIPITLFAAGLALERNPALCDYLKNSPHEIAGHAYRWIDYKNISLEKEREHIIKTLEIIKANTGKTAVGWYTGRKSKNTRRLVVEQGLQYDSDDYSDDIPFWLKINNKTHLIIPYSLDTNDCRYLTAPGFSHPDDFFDYLKASFDCLYEEGKTHPKMMTVGLHARISGRPARAQAVKKFIAYIKEYDNVWCCQRKDIADVFYRGSTINLS